MVFPNRLYILIFQQDEVPNQYDNVFRDFIHDKFYLMLRQKR